MWFPLQLTPARKPLLLEEESIILSAQCIYNKGNGTLYLTTKRLLFCSPQTTSFYTHLNGITAVNYAPRFLNLTSKLEVEVNDLTNYWTCGICFHMNVDLPQCHICGCPPLNTNTKFVKSVDGVCSVCTFKNHKSLLFCEMCSSPLKPLEIPHKVKFEFNKLEALNFKTSLEVNKPTQNAKHYGLKKLHKQINEKMLQEQFVLDEALKGSKQFEKHHAEVAQIALKYDLHPQILLPYDTNASHAQQLVDLLIHNDVLEKYGYLMTLYDVYQVYNRALGVSLINPKELVDALKECEAKNFPIKMRTLGKLQVVEARGQARSQMAKMVNFVQINDGVSAREVSEKFQFSIQIANENLKLAEMDGLVCRDEDIRGVRFYQNRFIERSEMNRK